MTRTASLVLNFAAAILIASGAAIAQSNTLLIIADDIGVDSITAYKEGGSPPPTPNIDALAKNGVLFRNAYANPICSPTRATIFTGRDSRRTGVGAALFLNLRTPLSLAEHTIGDVLGKNGYATGLFGKWHLTDPKVGGTKAPNDHGWSHFAGHLANITNSYYSWSKVVNGTVSTSKVYATTDNVNDAIAWIRKQSKPWLCCMSFNAAHTPLHAPPAALHSYDLKGKDIWSHMPLYYKAMVQSLDTEIGRLLSSLGSTVLKNTNVIFVGDNGTPQVATEAPFNSAHAKTTLYEGGVNVPLIVSGPVVDGPGREFRGIVATVDLFPTILHMSGVQPRPSVPISIPLDGVSFLPALLGDVKATRNYVYVERFGSDARKDGAAVLNGRYKLIRFAYHEEFYDLSSDPFEKANLLAGSLTQTQRDNLRALRKEMDRLVADAMPIGEGCGGKAGKPRIDLINDGLPRIGRWFMTRVANLDPKSSAVVGYLGLSDRSYFGFKLPLSLSGFGMPGCTLYTSLDFMAPIVAANGSALWVTTVPAWSGALGMKLYQQAFVYEPGANAQGIIATHGMRLVIGR